MITVDELKNIKKGDLVSYSFFKEVIFIECDGIDVILKDKHGNKI